MTLDLRPRFAKTLKQSLMAYLFNICGIFAGAIVAYNSELFRIAPWAVVVYPLILSSRGVIGGLFCGRLSTALHIGTIKPRFFGNTRSFYLLFQAIVFLMFEASVFMASVAVLFGIIYRGAPFSELWNMVNVLMATMTLSLLIVSPLTLAISFMSFKHGLDPDIILYPVESTTADLLITATYILVLYITIAQYSFWHYILLALNLALASAAVYILVKNMHEQEFIKTLRESLLTLIIVSFIINVAGAFLGIIDEVMREEQGVYDTYPIYVVYPALIDTIGDIGAVVGSTATTKLALGTLKASFTSIKSHFSEVLGAWAASLIMYFIYSVLAFAVIGALYPLGIARFSLLLFTVNILAAILIILVSYSVAIITYKRGLDPDNFEIPIESSLADTLTTISLLTALLLWGLIWP
ncbi:MAG: magnesium transporter [Candidatus Bathyarchaeota archaeon]|nr:magnesium transporter [Candidatus Bathyarchaeota archaeon]